MGKLVNVVLPGGKTVAVPEEDAARLSGTGYAPRETDQQAAARAVDTKNEERASGFAQGAKTIAEGGLDALTGGGFGKIAGAISPDYGEDLANRGQYRPGMRLLGEVGAFATGAGLPGLARGAGEAVTEQLAARALSPMTRGTDFLVKSAGRVVEGGIVGAGGHVATTNVTGDPLTIEGTMLGMGVGSFLQVGLGAAADKIANTGVKAGATKLEVAAQKADIETVKAGRDLFGKNVNGWDDFKAAADSAVKTESKLANQSVKDAKAYTDFLQPKRIDGAIRQAEKARNEVQARINQSKYGKAIQDTGEAFGEATEQLGKLKGKAEDFVGSTEKWPSTMQDVDKAIANVRGRWAPRDWEPVYKPKLQGYQGDVGADGLFNKEEAMYTATKKMPISKENDELLKEFSERASTIRKMRQGGFRLDKKKRWIADESVKPDVKGALEELHKLRTDFSKKFGGQEFPDLPDVPKVDFPKGGARPADGPAGQMADLKDLMQTSKALSDGVGAARMKFKAGDYEGATEELRALKSRAQAAGQNDLVLPDVPMKVQPTELPPSVKVPKTLHELANMEPATIEKLSNLVAKDKAAGEAFLKLNTELGTDAADSVAGLHSKLGKYMTAKDRLAKIAQKEAEEEGNGLLGFIKSNAKKFVRYGSARYADTAVGGGFMGAGARVVAGETAQATMNGIEDMISGAMVQGKLGIRQAIATAVTKLSGPTSRALKEIGPISSYLQNRLFTNEAEKGNHEELTVKRIGEIMQAAGAAPDAGYIAVQGLLGHPSGVALKLQQKAVADLQYLAQTAPKDPGIAMHGLKSDWKPSPDEALSYAHRIEAVVDPLKAIARTIAGDGHPAGVETLWTRWPALMATAAEEFALALSDTSMDRETAANYSTLFRTPITGQMTPEVMMTVQGLYLPKPEMGAGGAGSSGGGSGRPVGRPAAYDSQVAGSSVSGLLAA